MQIYSALQFLIVDMFIVKLVCQPQRMKVLGVKYAKVCTLESSQKFGLFGIEVARVLGGGLVPVVNLTLIDLPGLTKVTVEGQPESIVQDIENMVRSYVEKFWRCGEPKTLFWRLQVRVPVIKLKLAGVNIHKTPMDLLIKYLLPFHCFVIFPVFNENLLGVATFQMTSMDLTEALFLFYSYFFVLYLPIFHSNEIDLLFLFPRIHLFIVL